MKARWSITFTSGAAKDYGRLPESIQQIVVALVAEFEVCGPALFGKGWRHFGKLKGRREEYHCHLKAGRPTYVACWRVIDRTSRIMEVYYVGTHEGAPY